MRPSGNDGNGVSNDPTAPGNPCYSSANTNCVPAS